MKDWKIHPGIVCTEIHGVYLLVSDKEARKNIPYIQRINETGAFIFKQMKENRDLHEIMDQLKKEYNIADTEELREDINSFIESLRKRKYLLQEERG